MGKPMREIGSMEEAFSRRDFNSSGSKRVRRVQ